MQGRKFIVRRSRREIWNPLIFTLLYAENILIKTSQRSLLELLHRALEYRAVIVRESRHILILPLNTNSDIIIISFHPQSLRLHEF